MPSPSRPAARRLTISRDVALTATAVTTWCAMTMFVVSPLVAPFLLLGCVLIAVYWRSLDGTSMGRVSRNAVAAAAAMVIWFGVTTLWSVNRGDAAFAVFLFAATSAIVLASAALSGALARDVQRVIALAFTLAIGFAMWLSLEENASGMFLRRTLNSLVPMTRPHSVHLRMENGWIAALQPYLSNKNTVAVLFMAWPMVLVSGVLARTKAWTLARAATLVALVLGIAVSHHETSKLALVLSAAVFSLALWSRRTAFGAIVLLWTAATLLVVPVTLSIYQIGLFRSDALQYSARHRIAIWGNTSAGVLKKPLLGNGLASTRVLDELARPTRERISGTDFKDDTNMHAHNVFLQAWYETGAIGGVLMFLAGLPVLGWLRTRPVTTAPHLFAAFTTAVVVASLSWSLVASWYIAAFGLVAVWCRFADTFVRGESSEPANA